MSVALLVSCEHGGNEIPEDYRHLFSSKGAVAALASHRGLDFGAAALAERVAAAVPAPVHVHRISRLLVDANRTASNRAVFSEFSAGLAPADRRRLVARYHTPHRERVREAARTLIGQHGAVLHVAVHSFAPVLGGVTRRADIGLLYDPSRRFETTRCRQWQALLEDRAALRVRRNYPYRGVSDGLTTYLRTLFAADAYAGIELEINQIRLRSIAGAEEIAQLVGASLRHLLADDLGPASR